MQGSTNPSLRVGLDRVQAAAALNVSTRTLFNWKRNGYGPKLFRDGGRVLYDPGEVAAFAAGVR